MAGDSTRFSLTRCVWVVSVRNSEMLSEMLEMLSPPSRVSSLPLYRQSAKRRLFYGGNATPLFFFSRPTYWRLIPTPPSYHFYGSLQDHGDGDGDGDVKLDSQYKKKYTTLAASILCTARQMNGRASRTPLWLPGSPAFRCGTIPALRAAAQPLLLIDSRCSLDSPSLLKLLSLLATITMG